METQVKQMTLGDESVDYSSVSENYQSVDSKRFNNKLMIENTLSSEYAEIESKEKNGNDPNLPEEDYATVDLKKKREDRLKKQKSIPKNEDTIYEDIGGEKQPEDAKDSIYELVSYSEVGDKLVITSEYTEPTK